MADDKSSGAWSGGIVVAGIAAVSALYVAFQHQDLVSTRPQEAAYRENLIVAEQDIDARLWQDPFDAVARDVDGGDDRGARPGNAGLDGRDGDLAIIVTLSGAPYPEVAETRRRLRYAVLAAMHFRGFMPYDEKHIGYLRTDKPPFPPQADDTDGSLTAAKDRPGVEQAAWVDGIETLRAERAAAPLPKRIPFEQFEALSGVPERDGKDAAKNPSRMCCCCGWTKTC